jgi:hypothetical protein
MVQDKDGQEESIEIETYLKDVFQSFYTEFILNFGGMEEVMQGLGE